MPNGIAYISIGVADMHAARKLWVEELGLEIIASRQGPDAELAKLWGLPADQIVDQILLSTQGLSMGQLHIVQFKEPAEAARKGAAPTDLGPKNLDVNCTGMPELVEKLRQAGYAFRSEIAGYDVGDIKAREVQMPVNDDFNIVFIEILTEGFEVPYSPRGFAGITSFVVIVPDTLVESRFYQDVFGFDEIMHHRIAGPEIEAAVGLPKGTALDLRLCGAADNLFGRMELITYAGVNGVDRFKRAVPPATGILHCGFKTSRLEDFVTNAEQHGVTVGPMLEVDAIFGAGRMVELKSPAGLSLQVLSA